MSEFSSYAKNIAKGKLPYENWNQFVIRHQKAANGLARVQFSLNLVSLIYSEEIWQEDGLCALGEEFLEILKRANSCDFKLEDTEETVCAFRNKMKNHMDCLMAYVDRFLIYEYVWNCLRYQFEEYDYADYDDEEFTKELMAYILKDRDQSNIKAKMMEVLKALPVRLTRSRFFELVKDGFSVYTDSDKSTLTDFIYMLRTSSMLHEPENMKENFPELYEYAQIFQNLDYKELAQEEYYKQDLTLKECVDYLNNMLSCCQLFSETINQLYACILTEEYASERSESYLTSKEIIRYVLETFAPGTSYELDGHLTELLTSLEGEQEKGLEELFEAEGSLEDIAQTAFLAQAGEPIRAEYAVLDCVGKLLSTSYFADLEPKKQEENASADYVNEAFAAFRQELEPLLKEMPKLKARAVMAAVIGYLPMNFSTSDELHGYIYNSLNACTNLPEKMALVERLESIMNEEDWEGMDAE